ncbi:adenylyl cyclase X E-like [Drosophila subobscura]|uniref:adenylyl cyclase X E-like n=1 Tax=Drosophila subobscura TaxID=7241 RepID=UPI00155A5317|nr:adenylyl cyclase X E-like [Drosophila subobscura]
MPTSKTNAFEKCPLDYTKERRWEQDYLKVKCAELGLENEFVLYQRRQRTSYLRVFYLLHIIATLFHCTVILLFCAHIRYILFDIAVYVISAFLILSILSVNFYEDFVSRHTWILTATSAASALILVLADVLQGTFHYNINDWMLATSYDTYTILIIYMFLPIPSLLGSVLLASTVSVLFIAYFMKVVASRFHYFSMESVDAYNQMSVDIIHYICYNLLGVFFRIINDNVVRCSFLNRHQFIREKIWLRNARVQEKLLLDSIIPPQIAKPIQDDIKNRLARKGGQGQSTRVMEQIMALQIHPEVSILYADVVNYTQLTTTLDVERLVRLLHDLYGRFDLAATQFQVQRIKFLGDCYYCVAGLMRPNPDHAKCCVDLGLSMISHIQEVRRENDVDIDMRIGVHSGSVIAGVIGEAKLQFDIWGTDVTIANRLESTGAPGFIHISGSTLNELDIDQYSIFSGTDEARADAFLQAHNITTHLLTADIIMDPDAYRLDSWGSLSLSVVDINDRPELHTRSRMVIGPKDSIDEELRKEFKNMPVSGMTLGQSCSACCGYKPEGETGSDQSIQTFCLHFHDPLLEWKYLIQPDYMFKYSMLLSWCVGFSLAYVQMVESLDPCEVCILIDLFAFVSLTILLVIAWYKKICWLIYGRSEKILYGKWNCMIFHAHDKIVRHMTLRICIYIFILTTYFSIIVIIVINCNWEEFQMRDIESKLYHYELDLNMCFHPWVVTNMVALIIGISFTFARIPFMVKTVITVSLTSVYMVIVFFQFQFVFHHSATINPWFPSENAHGMRILMTLFTMYLKERHSEFNNKIGYRWSVDLWKKQKDADRTNQSITIVLNNILPSHVVNVYISTLAKHELYYEEYKMVSVMFASLQNFEMDLRNLRMLNEIIREFDRLLIHYKEYYVVEKIKVVGCTYMAACGLDVNYADRINNRFARHDSLLEEVGQAQRIRNSSPTEHKEELHEEVVFVMATFALDLMRTLWTVKKAYEELRLHYDRSLICGDMSIGISSGEVMAGVVGASHPHYDIWGDPVNMASRMYSTGLIGHIHVTEETANLLREFGVECIYRGITFVKGAGHIPTYFIAINDDYEFVPPTQWSNASVRRQTVTSFGAASESSQSYEDD